MTRKTSFQGVYEGLMQTQRAVVLSKDVEQDPYPRDPSMEIMPTLEPKVCK